MRFSSWFCPLIFLAFCSSAIADNSGAAVSAPSGKFSVEGGSYNDEGAVVALGSYAIPLGQTLGLQFDTAVGSLESKVMGGGGVHLFARDPSSYLLGVYGSYHTWDAIDIWRAAVEAEVYLGRFTLGGLAGYESVDVPSTSNGLPVITLDDDHFFAQTDLTYYVTDDFKLYGGYRYLNEVSFGAAGVEFLFRAGDVPLSVFANGNFGDGEYTRITSGFKVYLGEAPSKTLLARNRTSDPDNYTPVFPVLSARSTPSDPATFCENPANALEVVCICKRVPKNKICTGIDLQ